MASTTSVLGLTKPAYTDDADIGDINANADKIDAEAGRVRANFAGTYSASSAYAIGSYVIYQGDLYRCTTAIGSGGEAWNSAHWTQVAAGDEMSSTNSAVAAINGALASYVTGPSSVTDGTIPLYDGTTGKKIKAGKTISDATSSTAIANNSNIPTNRTIRNGIYNGLDKTAAGFALDARQGKALADRFMSWTGSTITISAGELWLAGCQTNNAANESAANAALVLFAKVGNYYRLSTIYKTSDVTVVYNSNGVLGFQVGGSYNNLQQFAIRLV